MPHSIASLTRFPWLRWAGTLTLAWLGAQLCVWAHTPIPWMLGPLVVTSVASLVGAPTVSMPLLRKLGQTTIAMALGLYFTPEMVSLIASLWWAIGLSILWSLVIGYGCGLWLEKVNAHPHNGPLRTTCYFSAAVGGASEMTHLAERFGGRVDWVASAHSLRVVMVVIAIPFAIQWSGASGHLLGGPTNLPFDPLGLAVFATGCLAAVALMVKAKAANPWFLASLGASIGLTFSGVHLSSIPPALSQAGQMFIGIHLGVQFTPGFLRTAPRWLGTVALSTLTIMGLGAGFSWCLAQLTDLPAATLVLATAPGGMAEMTITAKVLQLGVPIVTAMQVCRLVAVLLLVGPIYKKWVAKGA